MNENLFYMLRSIRTPAKRETLIIDDYTALGHKHNVQWNIINGANEFQNVFTFDCFYLTMHEPS